MGGVAALAIVAVACTAKQGGAKAEDLTKLTPAEVEAAAAKGTLKNPYQDTDAAVAEAGHKLFFSYSCNGCHGGNGGGGMCPPLINEVWVYGGDDDTLFRLVTLGSDALQKKGYVRKGHEGVVGPMPAFGPLIHNADELWKILAFVRSAYHGDPKYKYGPPPPPPEPKGE
jgi:mono/diheme cytochrome c family protein